jgi:hypothetical protein
MKFRAFGMALIGLSLSLIRSHAASGQTTALAQAEINYLLTSMGASGCEFYRNGSWYDSKTAQAHLSAKYSQLVALDRVRVAEDFIDQAATSSSLTGKAYAVRCGQDPAVSSSSWLYGLLARFRAVPAPDAPHDKRDASGIRPST